MTNVLHFTYHVFSPSQMHKPRTFGQTESEILLPREVGSSMLKYVMDWVLFDRRGSLTGMRTRWVPHNIYLGRGGTYVDGFFTRTSWATTLYKEHLDPFQHLPGPPSVLHHISDVGGGGNARDSWQQTLLLVDLSGDKRLPTAHPGPNILMR